MVEIAKGHRDHLDDWPRPLSIGFAIVGIEAVSWMIHHW
jgi:hypothetical protein